MSPECFNVESTNINYMDLKRPILTLLLMLVLLPLTAQEGKDYIFRFVAGKEMFYVPWNGNDDALSALLDTVNKNRKQLENGQMYILVSSHAATANDTLTATRMAYLRCHRVKSELITRGGVTEAMFLTERHIAAPYNDSLRNIVIVTLPAGVEKVAEIAGAEAAAKVEAYNKEISGETERERVVAEEKVKAEQEAKEQAERERIAAEKAAREKAEAERLAAEQAEKERLVTEEQARLQAVQTVPVVPYRFSLRANLLRWATLTPDLGIEWRINPSWGILVNGSWTSWSWNEKDGRYALWEVSPEVRYYIGKEKCGYVGAMFKAGQFNYKFSATGRQGDLIGGGITGGYVLKLNRALALDFNIGLGYLNADHDKYEVIDGVRVRRGTESKNWWGPVNAGVTLMWNLF